MRGGGIVGAIARRVGRGTDVVVWPPPRVGDAVVRPAEPRRRYAGLAAAPVTITVRVRNGGQGGPPGAGRGAQRTSPEGAAPDRSGVAPGAILVVDDDQAILATIEEILSSEGYPVTTALNGAQALERLDQARPALVLLDMRMPVLDGWGFARALRERGIEVPVLVMTAAQDARRWAEEIAADGYLPKPFRLNDLLDAVERYAGPPGA